MSVARTPHQILSEALRRQIRKNPAYSMRALAKATKISPSYLSRILAGKKPIPEERFAPLVQSLGMDETSCRLLRHAMFRQTVGASKNAIAVLEEILGQSSPRREPSLFEDFQEGVITEFSVLEPWYRIAVLDLVTCDNFNPSSEWIAERLGITTAQATEALRDLLAAGLLREKNGKISKTSRKLRFPTVRSNPTIRRYHQAMIDKAVKHMLNETDDHAFDHRLISSLSFAADPKNLKKARAILNDALYEVAEVLRQGDCTEIYQLNAQLFPLTRRTKS